MGEQSGMTQDILTALLSFALVTSVTPGPNNLMLMASGTNFGFRRTVPHMLGIGIGYPFMVFLVGVGVFRVFDLWPLTYTLLRIVSIVYLLYLAWGIANAAPPDRVETRARPLTFLQAASFQWVNPKAWSMALAAVSLYAPGRELGAILWVVGVYMAMSVISTTGWTVLGQQLRRFLNNPRRLRMFNIVMAVILLATLVPVLFGGR